MIGRISGKVVDQDGRTLVIDVNGVGYEVICSQTALGDSRLGASVQFVVHTDVKEDQITLYGFLDQLEKKVFLLLTQVKGVGAKSASEILSWVDRAELLRCIGTGNVHQIQQVKGIGKKTAERIVVELKDRVMGLVDERRSLSSQVERVAQQPQEEAVEALCALGFSDKEAREAVSQALHAGVSGETAEIVKSALQFV